MSTYESRTINAELDRQDRVSDDARALLRFLGQAVVLRMEAKKSYDRMPADSPMSPILVEFINGIEAAESEACAALKAVEHGRYSDVGAGMQPFFDKLTGGR